MCIYIYIYNNIYYIHSRCISYIPLITDVVCEDEWPQEKCQKKCNAKKCKKSETCKTKCKNTCNMCEDGGTSEVKIIFKKNRTYYLFFFFKFLSPGM